MGKVRVSTEQIFVYTITRFKFINFKKNSKIVLTPIEKQYRISVPLTNC